MRTETIKNWWWDEIGGRLIETKDALPYENEDGHWRVISAGNGGAVYQSAMGHMGYLIENVTAEEAEEILHQMID